MLLSPDAPLKNWGEERPRPARVDIPGAKLCPNVASHGRCGEQGRGPECDFAVKEYLSTGDTYGRCVATLWALTSLAVFLRDRTLPSFTAVKH